MALPPLRDEIALHAGPRLLDGQPTWTLQDPARNRFFRIDWQTFLILSQWDLGDPEAICASVAAHCTLRPQAADVEGVAKFLADNELVRPLLAASAAEMAARLHRMQGSWARRLLHNYLFFRIPLVNPDRWLGRLARRLEPLYSKGFTRLTVLALALGAVLVYRDWTQFSTTLVDTISWRGLAAYALALAVVKFLHELGHAVTAKRYGCRVPAMGVAFLVLWPVAYTDTNEVWKLADNRQRLAVASAGVATETVIAIWATLAWAVLPEGLPKSLAFVLATLTWVTTVAINASPFLRFDGYFVLSDWLDLPNLHSRAFALARWDLRERLFGLALPAPELFSRRRTGALILFAWATWLYRLAVFIGIALLVYHLFFKIAGVILFAVEIGWFIARPVWSELRAWRELWPSIRSRGATRRSALAAVLLVVACLVPWPTRVSASGQLKPAASFKVYAPAGAQVVRLPWRTGERVPAGASLVELASPELTLRWQLASARFERLRQQAATAGVDLAQQYNVQVLNEALVAAEAELASVQAEAARFVPLAPFAGKLYDLQPELRAGTWVRRQEPLLTLVDDSEWVVEAYLDEDAVRRVRAGDAARFFLDGDHGPVLALTLQAIDADATRALPDAILATAHGGSVITREKDGQLMPVQAVYRVLLRVQHVPPDLRAQRWRGRVVIHGDWEAPAAAVARSAATLLWRELGF